MKINILLAIAFISFIAYANISYFHGIVGLTKKDGGIGCVCHDLNPTDSVLVWIEGPDSVQINTSAQYKLFITGGPAVAGGFNIASFFGEVDSVDTLTKVLFGELTHTTPNPSINDTISWNFLYTAPNSLLTDTIYSVGNSVNGNGNPSNDQWNFGANFTVRVVDNPVPVELSNFSVTEIQNSIQINWTTITETNNSGFDIERKTENSDWVKLIFLPGYGTSTQTHTYSYNDIQLNNGIYSYRLKQINLDGSFVYSNVVSIELDMPSVFTLEQNYPNPFNPSTKIKFTIPTVIASGAKQSQMVTLKVYDILGNEVATLVNEYLDQGEYDVEFSAKGLTSGIYFYKLESGNYADTKKMILMK